MFKLMNTEIIMQMQLSAAPSSYRPFTSQVGPLPAASREVHVDELLDAIGTVVTVSRGAELFCEGEKADSWYQVRSGVLRTYKLMSDGRRQIDAFLMPGDFLGFEGLTERSFAAEAITQATVVRYSRNRIEGLAGENARFGVRLMRILLKRLNEAQEHLIRLGRKTAEEKVASFILDLVDRASGQNVIDLPMSRGDIADYLGLTIETVSRTISTMRLNGVIALPSVHRIVVIDRKALEELNGED